VTISTGQVDTSSILLLLDLLISERLHVAQIITHAFNLDQMEDAYEVLSTALTPAPSRSCCTAGEVPRSPRPPLG
jgi:alcohol dehydrogenase